MSVREREEPRQKKVVGVKDGTLLSPVKLFSIRRRVIYPILSFYSGLFFAGLFDFEQSGGGRWALQASGIPRQKAELLAAWIVFLAGILAGLYLLLGSRRWGFSGRSSQPAHRGRERDEFAPLMVGVAILLLAFHVKTSVLERIQVQGASMNPTLKSGQILWIEKLSTGLQLPALDFPIRGLFSTGKFPRFGWRLPDRGDVIVFRYPGNDPGIFIKRVIALPGERFAFRKGRIFINDRPISEPYLAPGTETHLQTEVQQPPVLRPPSLLDLLAPEVKYSAYYGCGESGTVPAHTVLVLGDNRSNSRDSRALGFIPTFFLVGTLIDMELSIGN